MSRRGFTHVKRRAPSPEEPALDEGTEMAALQELVARVTTELGTLHSAFNHEGVPNMRVAGDRRRLVITLWQGDYERSMGQLRAQNAELVAVLTDQVHNLSTESEHLELARARHVDGMLLDACRAQNQNSIPVLTAAMSILGEFNHVAREYHDALAIYHRGAALSEKWVRDFLVEARQWRPAPTELTIPGIAVAVFDNLSMKIDYSSYSTQGETGHQLNMTNWLSTRVPRALAPGLDVRQECAQLTN